MVLAACRGCGVVSARVRDRYRRRLADLYLRRAAGPGGAAGLPVPVRQPACAVATFAEQVPGLTSWYQRRTAQLRDLLETVALALAGRAGSRLAAAAGAAVSRFTLIRLVRACAIRRPGR